MQAAIHHSHSHSNSKRQTDLPWKIFHPSPSPATQYIIDDEIKQNHIRLEIRILHHMSIFHIACPRSKVTLAVDWVSLKIAKLSLVGLRMRTPDDQPTATVIIAQFTVNEKWWKVEYQCEALSLYGYWLVGLIKEPRFLRQHDKITNVLVCLQQIQPKRKKYEYAQNIYYPIISYWIVNVYKYLYNI